MDRLSKIFERDTYINSLLIIGTIFQSYMLFEVLGFEMTLPMIFIMVADFIFIIKLIKPKCNIRNIISIVFIIYIMFNYLINYEYSELGSMVLSIFFIGSVIFTSRNINEDKFNKYVKIYVIIATILSVYGIYQFIGRSNNLPFTDLSFEGYMVRGFNWTNPIWISGNKFIRINAIYREPSFYSQFTALAIIFIISNMINNKLNYKKIVAIIINLIGMVLSFSGTGFIILGIFMIYIFLFEMKNINKKIKYILVGIGLGILFIIINLIIPNNALLEYFISRFNEISNNSGSGGIRFVGAFDTLIESLKINPFLGHGIGSREIFFNKYASHIHGTPNIDSTIPRIGVELGLIGICLWILFMISFINRNTKNIYYRCIVLFLFVQLINGDYFLQITNWIFIYFINCNINFEIYKENNN